MLIFFYLSTILAYSQSYFLYLISLSLYLKLTKVKIQGGPPSKSQVPNCQLNDLQKLSEKLDFDLCLAMPRGITVYNRIRTTILQYKKVTKKSQKVPGRQNIRKLPYLCSNTL